MIEWQYSRDNGSRKARAPTAFWGTNRGLVKSTRPPKKYPGREIMIRRGIKRAYINLVLAWVYWSLRYLFLSIIWLSLLKLCYRLRKWAIWLLRSLPSAWFFHLFSLFTLHFIFEDRKGGRIALVKIMLSCSADVVLCADASRFQPFCDSQQHDVVLFVMPG